MNTQQKHAGYNINWFKRWAPIYDYVEIFVAKLRVKVADKIKKSSAKILDVACGTGNQSIAFAKKGHSVIGIDLSPDMLKYARKKIKPNYNIKFIQKDATKIPFTDSFFDVASISLGLHDMPEEVGIIILKEMIRTTKKNGQILIVDYNTPQNWLGHLIAKIWETKYYDHFLEVGLEYYLNKVGLKPLTKETYFFNNFQIVECVNNK